METLSNTMEGRIRQIMEAKQMSQKEFAECTNISPASLSSIFNGRTRATNNHTLAIHQAFPDVNINWLLFGEGSMYGSNESASDIPMQCLSHPTCLVRSMCVLRCRCRELLPRSLRWLPRWRSLVVK